MKKDEREIASPAVRNDTVCHCEERSDEAILMEEKIMNFKFEKSGGLGVLTFDGELTEDRAGRLKEALMVSLDNAEHVVINCEKVTKIDRICIQLFSLACRKSKRLRKSLILTGINPETYKQLEIIQAH